MQIGVETSKAVDQRRVFVVDDCDITRAALQFMLHDEIETHELPDMASAYAKGQDWLTPDLLMLGMGILKTEGLGLLDDIAMRYPSARILLVTGKEDEAMALEALRRGAHGALLKPLRIEAVRQKVDTMLGRAGAMPLIQLGGL
ncbi:DNA-binding NtrC family response regulator [Novosphingobium sp. SG751A]|uniref:response regulator n=1 Tax=Novosphingobium sp. SG751A TaxID=2587000 RepID=UPI00155799AC|nr:response regulator [Novosphingobium sp. SG751A]NOW48495.1 DNA-binding NtrC family response regulator [Novosphingobium sp. SG751A]